MKILHLNTFAKNDNRLFPSYQFHQELLRQGHRSVLMAANGDVNESNVVILNHGRLLPRFKLHGICNRLLFRKKNELNYYYYPEWNLYPVTRNLVMRNVPFKPDAIVAYWTKYAFNQGLLRQLSEAYNVPVFAFITDMAHYTGGCHYSYGCKGYTNQCGKCPALKSNKENDLSRRTWKYKKREIEKSRITLIAPSSECHDQAKESSLYSNKRIATIRVGYDTTTFSPNNATEVRQVLSIDKDAKVIFFPSTFLNDTRKGLHLLLDALDIIASQIQGSEMREKILLLFAGNSLPSSIKLPFKSKYLGYLDSVCDFAKPFQASDVLACPSIADIGPAMVILSMLSGRPVVSFDVGISRELVHTGKTGYLAQNFNSHDLAKGLMQILSLENTEYQAMSERCRTLTLKNHNIHSETKGLIELIRSR